MSVAAEKPSAALARGGVRFAQPRNAVAAALAALACCGIMAGCAGVLPYSLKPGASVDEVLRSAGRPGAEHALPGGGHKLEYSSGNQTYMLEFDPQGRLQSWENVLDEAHFNRVRAGITSRQLREQLGEPAMVWRVRYRDQTVWSYRFHGPFCQLFHVGITPAGIVEDTGYGPDPRCEREERSVSRGRW